MKKSYLLSLVVATAIFTGCGTTESGSSGDSEKEVQQSNSSNTSTQANENSSDNGTTGVVESGNNSAVTQSTDVQTTSNYRTHNQGKSCAECHSISSSRSVFFEAPRRDDENENEDDENEGNEGNENIFTSGATVFAKLNSRNSDARSAAYGYTLRLLLQGGEIQKYRSGRGTGNFNGTFNAGIDKYTAQVLDAKGNIVNTSTKNSHDAKRFDCNRCHTATGSNGAPGRIVAYSLVTSTPEVPVVTTPTTPVVTDPVVVDPVQAPSISFKTNVLPILNKQCASCHGSSGDFTITNSATPYEGVTPFVNISSATQSRLLQKASGQVGHAGGTVIGSTTADYKTIRDWIRDGALDN